MIETNLALNLFKAGMLAGLYVATFVVMFVGLLLLKRDNRKMFRFITKIKKQQDFEEYREKNKFEWRIS